MAYSTSCECQSVDMNSTGRIYMYIIDHHNVFEGTYHKFMPQSDRVHDLMWSEVDRIREVLDTVSVSE